MKLKSFGCSFVWGSEMADADPQPSRSTWPALLAQHLGFEYECWAQPGCGNLMVAEQVIHHLSLPNNDTQPAVFVINWTYSDRFDYCDPANDTWHTIRPGDDSQSVNQFYYRYLHSEYRDKLTTLMLIKQCQDLLDQSGHAYLMTYMDPIMLDQRWHQSPAVYKLQQQVRPNLLTFDGVNMLEYSRQRGHSITQRQHPLEAAHLDLFAYAQRHWAGLL